MVPVSILFNGGSGVVGAAAGLARCRRSSEYGRFEMYKPSYIVTRLSQKHEVMICIQNRTSRPIKALMSALQVEEVHAPFLVRGYKISACPRALAFRGITKFERLKLDMSRTHPKVEEKEGDMGWRPDQPIRS